MFTAHPTLLIGPSDWQPERMPQETFEARIAALWKAYPDATRAVVYGNPAHHAELAYLTNLVPKLEAGVALLARDGAPALLLGGGPNMLGAAKPLTFISDLAPLRGGDVIGQAIVKDLGQWDQVLLIGTGYMPTALRNGITSAIGEVLTRDATPRLWELMRPRSTHELAAVREACTLLTTTMAGIDLARREGASVTAAVLAGECAANAAGAQDVRTLFSRDGGRTLQPFMMLSDQKVDPLQVYVAVRRFNYWAEGFAPLADTANPIRHKAGEVLRRALAAIKPGKATADVVALIAKSIKPYQAHPVTDGACLSAIGLALHEPPYTDAGETFAAGETYSVKIGASDGAQQHAIVSAMIAVRDGGHDLLWTSA
jgi:Xaa-Pro aminopeptidase